MRFELHNANCMDLLPTLSADSIESLVTDPPAGIGFMGKDWDNHSRYEARTEKARTIQESLLTLGIEPWEAGFAAFTCDWATEALRVLKPGAYGVVWAIPRTADLTGLGLRLAGFEVRNSIQHIFGSGFPKSLNVSKAVDALLGAERPVVGTREQRNPYIGSDGLQFKNAPDYIGQEEAITVAATPEAKAWEGWGTDLKPAQEQWILIRKPLAEDTVAENVLRHGVGGINLDGCRVATTDSLGGGRLTGVVKGANEGWNRPYMDDPDVVDRIKAETVAKVEKAEALGRFPPNLLLTHHPDCRMVGTKTVSSDRHNPAERGPGGLGTAGHKGQTGLEEQRLTEETVDAWECVDGCPVKALDEQSGERTSGMMKAGTNRANQAGYVGPMPEQTLNDTYGDTGGASRFFPQFAWDEEDLQTAIFLYAAKASRAERNKGCGTLEERSILWSSGEQNPGSFQAPGTNRKAKNFHPTVKPKALMRWLCRLVTPPGGTVLDCFMGSGSTGMAATSEGFGFIGSEINPDYFRIAEARNQGEQIKFSFA